MPLKKIQIEKGLQPRSLALNPPSIYCRSMTRNIKRQKEYTAREKQVFAYQDRDIACNPVCPRSEIAVREDNPGPYIDLLGKRLRVGYYRRRDGLNVIWIVYPNAAYGETTDHSHLRQFFKMVFDSGEADLYGDDRPVLEPL